MDRFFDEQGGVVSCLIQHLSLVPQNQVMVSPSMLSNGRLLWLSSSGRCLVLLHPGLKGSLGLSYVHLATAARDLIHNT